MDNNNLLRIEALLEQDFSWLIVDAATCAEAVWFAKGTGTKVTSLFELEDLALADSGPWLIDIRDRPDIVRVAIDKDRYGHGCLWLNSELEERKLCRALIDRLYAELPYGEITRFRWYDPRVLQPWLLSCQPTRVAEFLAPFKRLCHASLNPFYFSTQLIDWQTDENGLYHQAVIALEEPSDD